MLKSKFVGKLKNTFLTGLVVSAPLLLSLMVFFYVLSLLDNFLGRIIYPVIKLSRGPKIPGLGLIALIIIIFFSGVIVRWYLGKKILSEIDHLFAKLPVLRLIYNSIKQIGDYFVHKKRSIFKYVVFVPWPTEKTYMLGFVSEDNFENIPEENIIPVFIPTTPNPTTGFVVFSKKKYIKMTTFQLDEALKMMFSAGVIKYENQIKETLKNGYNE